MIHATDLETPERGLSLETREEPEAERPGRKQSELRALREEAAAARRALEEYRAKVQAARNLAPPKQLHRVHNCRTCFNQARDATIRAIEGEP